MQTINKGDLVSITRYTNEGLFIVINTTEQSNATIYPGAELIRITQKDDEVFFNDGCIVFMRELNLLIKDYESLRRVCE